MKLKRTALFAAAALLSAGAASANGPATTSEPAMDVAGIRNLIRSKTTAIKKLPAGGLVMVEADGQIFVSSENGRIIVSGARVFDTWNNSEIKDVGEIDKLSNKIDLAMLGVKIDELGPLETGMGKKTVVMFVDPSCPHCHRMMAQAAKLSSDYKFQFVLLPLLGPESIEKAKKAVCASDKQAAAKALVDETLSKFPAPDPSCSLIPLQKALVTAKVIGVDSVPFIIAPDGTMQRGAPKDLNEWLSSLDSKNNSASVVDKHTQTRNNKKASK